MRSRCFGSMLAWILNTKPENGASAGSTMRAVPASRGCGCGAQSSSACRISCTPKLLIPEPKNTGVCWPGQKIDQVERAAGAADEVDIVAQFADFERELFVENGLSMPSIFSASVRFSSPGREAQQAVVAEVIDAAEGLAHADRPGDRAHSMSSTSSISSSSSNGSRTSRSSLLTKVMIGVLRMRQTSSSLIVCASTPFGRVDHHHRGVDGGQHAVGVSEKSSWPGVSSRLTVCPVLELHHRAGHRDAALLFDLHPVRGRVARALAALDRAGELDRAAELQWLARQRSRSPRWWIFPAGIWSLSFYAGQILRKDMERRLGEQQFATVSLVASQVESELATRLHAGSRRPRGG